MRTHLPAKELHEVKTRLLNNLHPAQFDKHFFSTVQEKVTAYFEGEIVNFGCDIPLLNPSKGEIKMAQKLDDSELVSFKELLMANSIQVDTAVQLLIEKGFFTQDEFFTKLKQVRIEYMRKKTSE